MSIERINMGGAEVNGKIYVVGGIHKLNTYFKLLEVYSPLSVTWTTKAE